MDLLLALACTSTPTSTGTDGDPPVPPVTTTTWEHTGSWHSGETGGHTGSPPGHSAEPTYVPYADCTGAPPPGPRPFDSSTVVSTEEDFDFDTTGYLLTQRNTSLLGITRTGDSRVIAADIGADAAGIRTLVTGDILVAQPDTGGVRRVDRRTGGSVRVLSGLTYPNGLEASRSGLAYVSEYWSGGQVREFNPYTGDFRVIAQLNYPNGLVLSPDELTLYVATSSGYWFGTGRVVALDKDPGTGEWGAARLVYQSPVNLGGLTVDVCGNLYVTEYSTGRVLRIYPDGTSELIAELHAYGYGSYSAAHFSPGLSGWSTTELYVTDRVRLYAIDLGITGRHVLN